MLRNGRHPSKSSGDSMHHVIYKMDDGSFESVSCNSDNGIFVNNVFYDDHSVKFKSPAPPSIAETEFINNIRKRLGPGDIRFVFDDEGVGCEQPDAVTFWDRAAVLQAIFVRLLLIGHNIFTAWRVVESFDESFYWLLCLGNILMLTEGIIILIKRSGVEYSWWCPCFLVYLLTTLPGIWLLQLHQNDLYVASQQDTIANVSIATSNLATTVIYGNGNNATDTSMTELEDSAMTFINSSSSSTTLPTSTLKTTPVSAVLLLQDNDVWIIIVQESLIYLLVLGRWMLPRGKVSRDFLADLLLEFLAIASDIMELLAVFDEDQVRANRNLTYAILTIWSASFIQFVPILMQKRRFRHVRHVRLQFIERACADKFVEVVVMCMSIFLQDGTFLVLRLYIMIHLNLVTYSLVFFVLKNIVTLLLLFYRLALVCYRLPFCYRDQGEIIAVSGVDLNKPVKIKNDKGIKQEV